MGYENKPYDTEFDDSEFNPELAKSDKIIKASFQLIEFFKSNEINFQKRLNEFGDFLKPIALKKINGKFSEGGEIPSQYIRRIITSDTNPSNIHKKIETMPFISALDTFFKDAGLLFSEILTSQKDINLEDLKDKIEIFKSLEVSIKNPENPLKNIFITLIQNLEFHLEIVQNSSNEIIKNRHTNIVLEETSELVNGTIQKTPQKVLN